MSEYLNNFITYFLILSVPVLLVTAYLGFYVRRSRERMLRAILNRQIASQQRYLDKISLAHKREIEKRSRAAQGLPELKEDLQNKAHTLDDINRIARMYNYVVYVSITQLNQDHIDDLLAVPWSDNACDPDRLISMLCKELRLKVLGDIEEHSQRRYTIHLKSQVHEHFQLSIMKPCSCTE